MRWRNPLLAAAALILAVFAVAACARRDQAAVEQQAASDAQRRIYHGLARPLISGDQRLAETLPRADTRLWALTLSASGATPLAASPDAEACCREDIAVLVATADGGRYVIDPRSLRLQAVATAGFSLYRALLVTRSLSRSPGTLDLYRFDLVWTGDAPAATAVRRLTEDGGNALPVHLPASDLVIYERAGSDGRHALMRISVDGSGRRPLLPERAGESRLPCADATGGVVFAGRDGAAWRLFRHDPVSGSTAPWSGGALAGAGDLAVACALDDGRLRPVVVGISGRLSLAEVAALVEARNPAVLRRRALLAASLIEAQQLGLANLPTVHFGAFWTPVVGIFTDPLVFTGDFLGEGLVRGVVGVTQSLLDIDRNRALTQAGTVRASIARDALADELNRQQAEAALCYAALQALRERVDIDHRLIALAERASGTLVRQRSAGRAGEQQALVAEHELLARRGELAADQRWQEVLTDRLRGLCGLPAATAIETAAPARWEDSDVDAYPVLLRTALLNHPRLRAAQSALREAFWNGQTGSRWRPSLEVNAAYAYTSYHATDPVDDFVSLGLTGALPLAWFKDRDLEREHHQRLEAALRAGEEIAAQELRRDIADAWAAWHQARAELIAQRALVRSTRETARAGLLRAEHGQPGVDGPLGTTALFGLERTALTAERTASDSWRQVAERYVRLVQGQGLAGGLAQEAARLPAHAAAAMPTAATWAWQRDRLLADGGAAALAAAGAAGISRIYLYLGPDAAVLAAEGERISAFVANAAAARIAVWGLLGEPEWFGSSDHLAAACARIAAFQLASPQRLQGVKLDLEPHTLPGWADPGAGRAALAERWVALVAGARADLAMPLWIDVPMQLFRPEHAALRERLAAAVDGATAMCYSSDGARVRAMAELALAGWRKDIEIGIELRTGGAADETLATWTPTAVSALRREIEDAGAGHPRFRGVAVHDLDELVRRATGPSTDPAPPPSPRPAPSAPLPEDLP